ncbi:hypothetical protein [Actinokineospora iranica]|uniref:Probable extracellular repeat, HAF family n=1 Tax=Actinokineospora iranica TaxID=1271860 RepID=A0A1G6Z9X5_9PSEU|nr:hypothetical protein [Actinokineospora iranica]SDD99448.1 probable extracellular repeat, HAF family [Actinokineospora iranica]
MSRIGDLARLARQYRRATLLAVVVAVAIPLATAPPTQGASLPVNPLLSAVVLPALPGHTRAEAVAVNDLGQIAGTSTPGPAPSRAVLWSGQTATDLGGGHASGINSRGQVVGWEYLGGYGTYVQQPRLWHRGTTTDLTPPGSGLVVTSVVNRDGVVPMTYSASPSGYHQERAAVYSGGTLTPIEPPGVSGPHLSLTVVTDRGVVAGAYLPMFGADSFAFRCEAARCARLPGPAGRYSVSAANEKGVLVGTAEGLPTYALRWDGDRVSALPPLAGEVSARVAPGPQAVNESGDVVGHTVGSGGLTRATLWRRGQAIDLGAPLGHQSQAVAVNDFGDVVGWSEDGVGQRRAFLWRDGRSTDLGTVGGQSSEPVALNNWGVIVGRGVAANGGGQALKWVVAPLI